MGVVTWTESDRQIAGLMLALGMTAAQAGSVVGRTKNTVKSQLSKGRIERAHEAERLDLSRRRRPWTEDEDILVEDLHRRGLKDSQIAEFLRRNEADVTARRRAFDAW